MKRIYLFLPVLIFCINTLAQDTSVNKAAFDYWPHLKAEKERIEGRKFPAFSINTKDTYFFSNAAIANKTVFIHFWYAACTPCIAEMKGLNQLYEQLRNNKDFLFVSFCSDPDSVIEKSIAKYNIQYPVIHLDKPDCRKLNFNSGFPTSFILDKNGIIRFFSMGGSIDEEDATEELMEGILPKIIEQLSVAKEKALPNKTK